MIAGTELKTEQIGLDHEYFANDKQERDKHFNTIESLAKEINVPLLQVAKAYESILLNYLHQAKIPDYLHVLVSKKVREMYRSSM